MHELPDGALFPLLVSILMVKMLELTMLIAIIATWFYGQRWSTIIGICLAVALLEEWLLHQQHARPVSLISPAFSFIAALLWALMTLGVRKLIARRRPPPGCS